MGRRSCRYVLQKKCPFLEQLCLLNSFTTTNLKIAGGDSFKLKYLDLYNCVPMENLEIHAPNLVSFSYNGRRKEVPFKNITKSWYPLPNPPMLCNLKMLELRVPIPFCYSPTWLISIIKATPTLSKCVVKLLFLEPPSTTEVEEEKFSFKLPRHRRCSIECSHHQRLKEIEFVGFVGLASVFRLAVSLLEVSAVLEKFTVDTRPCGFQWGPDVFCNAFANEEVDDSEGVREIAQKLRSHEPPEMEELFASSSVGLKQFEMEVTALSHLRPMNLSGGICHNLFVFVV